MENETEIQKFIEYIVTNGAGYPEMPSAFVTFKREELDHYLKYLEDRASFLEKSISHLQEKTYFCIRGVIVDEIFYCCCGTPQAYARIQPSCSLCGNSFYSG